MLVRYLTGFAGEGFVIDPGTVIDEPEAKALRLIELGCAELAEPPRVPEVETASVAPSTGQRKRKQKVE
jgi:hypothetical protein